MSMRLVLLGAPGSGKGTQAAQLKERLNIPHVSTGELLRAAVRDETQLGRKAKAIMERGELVSDDLVLGMLRERLEKPDCATGFILDGYPRNLVQAEALDGLLMDMGQPVDQAILIEVDPQQIVKRLSLRAEEEGRAPARRPGRLGRSVQAAAARVEGPSRGACVCAIDARPRTLEAGCCAVLAPPERVGRCACLSP